LHYGSESPRDISSLANVRDPGVGCRHFHSPRQFRSLLDWKTINGSEQLPNRGTQEVSEISFNAAPFIGFYRGSDLSRPREGNLCLEVRMLRKLSLFALCLVFWAPSLLADDRQCNIPIDHSGLCGHCVLQYCDPV